MGLLWVAAQSRRFTKNDLLAEAASLGCNYVKPRTIRTYVEHGLLDHPTRDWPGRGGGSSGGWWPYPQFALWHAEILQCVRMAQRLGREVLVFPGLYNIPVSGWLYFGEAGGVPLAQVRRAMHTWNKTNYILSIEEAKRLAASLVRTAAHPQAEDRLALRKQLVEMMQTRQYPDHEELLYALQQLIDPRGRGAVKGPAEAPLSPENLCDMILGRAEMSKRLRDEPERIPDGLWEWARFVLLWTRGWYQEAQPRLANDPSVRAFPELRSVYRPENLETAVNAACGDLLAVLATAQLAKHATHLPLELRPDPWLAGTVRLVVESRPELSPIMLPDGSLKALLRENVRLVWSDH